MTEARFRAGLSLSQVLLLLMGILMVYLVVDFGRQVIASHQRREELQRLDVLVTNAQAEKAALEKRVEYDASPQAAEAWAREQGWVKPDEVPVVLVAPQASPSSAAPKGAVPNAGSTSSPQAWWDLFFGDR